MGQRNQSTGSGSTAVVGLQWGDEGKGKIVDMLARDHDAVVRYNGGANAGHSVVVKGTRYALHLIPSGILYPGKAAVIGNGVVVDPWKLMDELSGLREREVDTSSLVVSSRAHAVLPYHQIEDGLREDLLKNARRPGETVSIQEIGTTRRGIGPAYADKIQRASAVRMSDLLRPEILREKVEIALTLKRPLLREYGGAGVDITADEVLKRCEGAAKVLAPMIKDTTVMLHGLLEDGKRLLFEGANGTLLDVDHGTYPFVTSSNCGTAGIGSGTGVPLTKVGKIVGVMKAYSTRVGSGPMPTELKNEIGDRIRTRGREFGTTTGRPRRVGWLDLVAVRYASKINGVTEIAMTLLDVLAGFNEIKVCSAYRIGREVTEHFTPDAFDLESAEPIYESLPGFREDIATARGWSDLPDGAKSYISFIESKVGVPLSVVSVGPDREQTIHRV